MRAVSMQAFATCTGCYIWSTSTLCKDNLRSAFRVLALANLLVPLEAATTADTCFAIDLRFISITRSLRKKIFSIPGR